MNEIKQWLKWNNDRNKQWFKITNDPKKQWPNWNINWIKRNWWPERNNDLKKTITKLKNEIKVQLSKNKTKMIFIYIPSKLLLKYMSVCFNRTLARA